MTIHTPAEQRLLEGERELQDFLDNASEALNKIDARGTILWANRAELEMLGYTAGEYIGRHAAEFHVDRDRAESLLRRMLAGETLRDQPAKMRCKGGAVKDVLISCNGYWKGGRYIYARCFTRDVTSELSRQRVFYQEARAWEILNRTGTALASELEPEKLVQIIADAATVLTRAQHGAFFSKRDDAPRDGDAFALYASAGTSREACTSFIDLLNAALFAPVLRGERTIRVVDLRREDIPSRQLPFRSCLAVPVVARSGNVYGALFLAHLQAHAFTRTDELIVGGIAAQAAIAIDNSRLFKASQTAHEQLRMLNDTLEQRIQQRTAELHRSEFQFSRLVEGVTDYAIYMLNQRGDVISWNTGAERITGYRREQILGKHFSMFYTEQDQIAGEPQRTLATAMATGKYEAEAWRVRKGGERFWASVLIDALHDDKGELLGFAKVTRDMTERRMLEEKLHQAQKMEAIGQLTGGVAHDFNNLLTVIIGNLDTIARLGAHGNARVWQAIRSATRSAQRAATLTQQLLAFSRRQTLNPKLTDINQLVSSMSNMLCRTLSENITVETVLASGLPPAHIDAHQLESAILNLAVNARDAMQLKGGKLTIITGKADISELELVAAELAPGRYLSVSIGDTGVGMTSEVASRAFEPFFTTKPLGQGTGLGLSQVYGFVKQSGGHVKIHSILDKGTTITIYLPSADVSTSEAMNIENESTLIPRSHGHETILVVEDDVGVRQYSTDSLRDLGFTVFEAPEATTALRLLDEHPEIRLLLTDVGLPGLNGRDLVEQAHERHPGLKVLFTTGYARDIIKDHLAQGIELLPKPFTRVELANRVRAALDATVAARREQRPVALVVDDETLVAQFVADTLDDLGFRVVQAGTVAEAVAAAKNQPYLAVALVDLGLPDRSGLELISELKKLHPRLPVLIATGYGAMAQRDLGEDNRPPQVLSKPYNAAAISKALGELGVIVPRRLLN